MKKLLLLAAIVFFGSTCNNKPQKVITPLIVKNDMKGYALVISARSDTSYYFFGLKSKGDFRFVIIDGWGNGEPYPIEEMSRKKHFDLFESDTVYQYDAQLGGEIIFPDSAAAVTALNNYLGKVAIYNKYVDSLKQYHHYKQINQ